MFKTVWLLCAVGVGSVIGMQQAVTESSASCQVTSGATFQETSACQTKSNQQFLYDKFWHGAYEQWNSGKLDTISPLRPDSDDARIAKIFYFLGLASIKTGYLDRATYTLISRKNVRDFPNFNRERLSQLNEMARNGTLLENLDQDRV